MGAPLASPYVRDRFTWLAYAMLAYFAYTQATLGPLIPFLRDELDLNYTISGLHLSAFAVGMVLAGALGNRFAQRWGRSRVFWGGGAGMAAGAILFILGHHPALTITSALIMGLPGTLVMIMVQAALSDRHGAHRAIALTESNVGAALSAGLAPLMVGLMQRIGIGWRGALVSGALAWVLLTSVFHSEPIPRNTTSADNPPSPPPNDPHVAERLPATYWAYWLVVFLSVSVEWCVVFWGADFLETDVGLSKVNASSLISVFFVAMVIGRFTGSRLSRLMPLGTLLLLALSIAIAGFLPFWLAPAAVINIVGLFFAGLGIANLFPLTLSAASSIVTPAQADIASSRITLAAGMAILISPQLLGALADKIDIKNAYGIAALFLIVAIVAVLCANRLAFRDQARQNRPNQETHHA